MKTPNVPRQLADTWTRLYRAKENYDALTLEVNEFLYEYVKRMVRGWNQQSQAFVLQLPHPRESEITGRTLSLVGDIVEDLRAALDYMVFALSALNAPDLKENIPQFVIADTETDFEGQSKRRLCYLTKEQKTDFIRKLQPFNGNPMLGLLRDIAGQSKHRRLLSVRNDSDWEINMDVVRNRDKYKGHFVYPMEKGRAIFARPDGIRFLLLEKYDAMSLLKAMAEHVGEIVEQSHCFFEGRPFKMKIVSRADSEAGTAVGVAERRKERHTWAPTNQ